MTGTEAALAARKYANAYKYIYGAKGEFCSSAHIEELIAQSPTYFSDAQKKGCSSCKGRFLLCRLFWFCVHLFRIFSVWILRII